MSIEYDINKRWEQGTPHHPKSVALFKRLSDIDFKQGNDFFCWKSGGDGDNGEHMMYEMDIMFEEDDVLANAKPHNIEMIDKAITSLVAEGVPCDRNSLAKKIIDLFGRDFVEAHKEAYGEVLYASFCGYLNENLSSKISLSPYGLMQLNKYKNKDS